MTEQLKARAANYRNTAMVIDKYLELKVSDPEGGSVRWRVMHNGRNITNEKPAFDNEFGIYAIELFQTEPLFDVEIPFTIPFRAGEKPETIMFRGVLNDRQAKAIEYALGNRVVRHERKDKRIVWTKWEPN